MKKVIVVSFVAPLLNSANVIAQAPASGKEFTASLNYGGATFTMVVK